MLRAKRLKSKITGARIIKGLIGKPKSNTVTYVQNILTLDLIVHSSFIDYCLSIVVCTDRHAYVCEY